MSDAENKDSVDARVYELGYLLVPSITEEDVPVHYGNLKELVHSLGGEVVSDEMPRMIPLAYSMTKVISNIRHKFSNGYFGWVKFMLDPEKAAELKQKLALDSNFLRFLIVKTVKENTIASRRFMRMDSRRTRPAKKPEGEAVSINKEEIDKEIDAMVAQ